MTMTRQHFCLIADVIKRVPSSDTAWPVTFTAKQREYIARCFADELYATNGRFDRDRFMRACGVEQ
jgi:hypothetical protein